MARMRMVTRTVNTTVCTVMCVEVTTAKVENHVFEISGTFDTTPELLKAVQKLHDSDTFKVVAIVSAEEKEVLYGMPESDFIAHATVLPPRKANEDTGV